MSAVAMTLRRLKWDWPEPHIMVNDLGVKLNLSKLSPRLIQHHVERTVLRAAEHRIAAKTGDPALAGKRADTAILRAMLDSRAKGALSAGGKCVLRGIAANAFWTRDRLAMAGYDVEPWCPLCSTGARDTIHHRAWVCPCAGAVRAREAHASPELIREAVAAGEGSALFTRALCAHVVHSMPPVGEQVLVFERGGQVVSDRAQWTLHGNVYYDGSCQRRHDEDLCRASFAAVEVDEAGVQVASIMGTVPPCMPQSSQAAEHCGRTAAVQCLSAASILVGDCKAVVDSAGLPDSVAAHHRRMHAGARREATLSGKAGLVSADRKVTAHRSCNAARDADDRFDIMANDAADRAAVRAQQLHARPNSNTTRAAERELEKLDKVAWVLVATVPLWPKVPKSRQNKRAEVADRKRKLRPAPERVHDWAYRRGPWLCTACHSVATNDAHMQRRKLEECPGATAALAKIVAQPQGHVLASTFDEAGSGILLCARCGSWATCRPRLLAQPCRGQCKRGSAGRLALTRLAGGKHPDHNCPSMVVAVVMLSDHIKLSAADVIAALLRTA